MFQKFKNQEEHIKLCTFILDFHGLFIDGDKRMEKL